MGCLRLSPQSTEEHSSISRISLIFSWYTRLATDEIGERNSRTVQEINDRPRQRPGPLHKPRKPLDEYTRIATERGSKVERSQQDPQLNLDAAMRTVMDGFWDKVQARWEERRSEISCWRSQRQKKATAGRSAAESGLRGPSARP